MVSELDNIPKPKNAFEEVDPPSKPLARKNSCLSFLCGGEDEIEERPLRRVKSDNQLQVYAVNGGALAQEWSITTREVGTKGTLDYRLFFDHKKLGHISPWHDIPLHGRESTYHFLCEIPKWSRAKFEISVDEDWNPIKQDESKGDVRVYKHGDMLFNYGLFPQTWEDPEHIDKSTGCRGDNDPLDCIEVGTRQMTTGQIEAVKVLGILAMIDDNETDWKVITIRADDVMAPHMDDIGDLEREIPGCVTAIREWLRNYKVAEGKGQNRFALNDEAMNASFAVQVIQETHQHWRSKYASKQKLQIDIDEIM